MSGRSIATLVVVALVVFFGLLGGGGMMGWDTGTAGMMGWGGSGFSSSGIMMLLAVALVIGGVVWLGASLVSPRRSVVTVPGTGSARPLDILKERYARGELTREDYDRIREELAR
jgi:putative membrane protein